MQIFSYKMISWICKAHAIKGTLAKPFDLIYYEICCHFLLFLVVLFVKQKPNHFSLDAPIAYYGSTKWWMPGFGIVQIWICIKWLQEPDIQTTIMNLVHSGSFRVWHESYLLKICIHRHNNVYMCQETVTMLASAINPCCRSRQGRLPSVSKTVKYPFIEVESSVWSTLSQNQKGLYNLSFNKENNNV